MVILFGFGIVLKDGLEFLSYLAIDISQCKQNQISAALSMLNILFVLSQVRYLFRFSKVYIRNCNGGSRYNHVPSITVCFINTGCEKLVRFGSLVTCRGGSSIGASAFPVMFVQIK